MERLLFFNDNAPSTSAFLYQSYAQPKRMAVYGGVTADTTVLVGGVRAPFGGMAQYDLLRFYSDSVNPSLATNYRKVATVVDNRNITVDSALTFDGTNWDWMKVSRGLSTDTDGAMKGWVSVGTWRTKTLIIQMITFPAEGLNLRIETRDAGQQNPSVFYSTAYSTINDLPQTFDISADVASVRVGVQATDTGSVSNGSFTISLRGDSAR